MSKFIVKAKLSEHLRLDRHRKTEGAACSWRSYARRLTPRALGIPSRASLPRFAPAAAKTVASAPERGRLGTCTAPGMEEKRAGEKGGEVR